MNITKNTSHQEGEMTKAIENQTAKLPSTVYLGLALASMAISLGLKVAKQNNRALFVGQWAAPLLIMGIYNKIVKVEGND